VDKIAEMDRLRALGKEKTEEFANVVESYQKLRESYRRGENETRSGATVALDKGKLPPSAVKPVAPETSVRHGVIRRAAGGNPIAPFSVKTRLGATYFLKLVRPSDNQEQIAGFIVGGQPFSTKVPLGTYELRYAAGQEWIDEQEYFGPQTTFYKADRLLTFSVEGDRVFGSEVELILQRGGNLRTSTIAKDKF
jgi:hypothetical protein